MAKVSGQMLEIHPARRVVTCTICPVTPLEKIPRHQDKRGWFQSGSIEAFPTRAIAAARGNPCWAARASAASASAAAGSSGLFILAVARACLAASVISPTIPSLFEDRLGQYSSRTGPDNSTPSPMNDHNKRTTISGTITVWRLPEACSLARKICRTAGTPVNSKMMSNSSPNSTILVASSYTGTPESTNRFAALEFISRSATAKMTTDLSPLSP